MPVSELLNHPWYETPNIHLCTIRDFVVLVEEIGARIERSVPLDRHGHPLSLNTRGRLANLLAEQGVFVLCGKGTRGTAASQMGSKLRDAPSAMIIAQLSDPHIVAPGSAALRPGRYRRLPDARRRPS